MDPEACLNPFRAFSRDSILENSARENLFKRGGGGSVMRGQTPRGFKQKEGEEASANALIKIGRIDSGRIAHLCFN